MGQVGAHDKLVRRLGGWFGHAVTVRVQVSRRVRGQAVHAASTPGRAAFNGAKRKRNQGIRVRVGTT